MTEEPYARYRKRTGLCETCHQTMANHIKCYLCGALLGEGHISPINNERHCGRCVATKKINKERRDYDNRQMSTR